MKPTDPRGLLTELCRQTPVERDREQRLIGLRAAFYFLAQARTLSNHRVRTAAAFHIITGGFVDSKSLARKCNVSQRRMQQEIRRFRNFVEYF